jgi:intraflagellar transport protein 52
MGADFVYANGSTLTVKTPSYPILTSGPLTYPSNKPVSAVHLNKSGGKLLVCGSINMFTDDYF